MADMKFCKDCKWCRPDSVPLLFCRLTSYEFVKCAAPEVMKEHPRSLVAGTTEAHCSVQRAYTCGPEGKYWEAR